MAGTTTGASHKNTQHTKVPTGTTGNHEKATCTAEGIEAFCEHAPKEAAAKGGAEKSELGKGTHAHSAYLKTPPPAPPKHAAAAPPEDKKRYAKEEVEAPTPVPPKQGQPAPPPKPGAKALVLQLVPSAPEDKETGGKVKVGEHVTLAHGSTEVGPVKHVAGTPGKGDRVKIFTKKGGTAEKCPEWAMTDYGTGHSAVIRSDSKSDPILLKPGSPLIYTFKPPDPKELAQHIIRNPLYRMGWLEAVKPRHYTVTCTSPFPTLPPSHAPAGHLQHTAPPRPAPGAHPAVHKAAPPAAGEHPPPGHHHSLEVYVYPSDKWTLKLTSIKSKHQPAWLNTINEVKEGLEALIEHASELAHDRYALIPTAKLKLFDGDLSLSNFWEEKEDSNLVQWTAELEGKVTIIDLTLTFGINVTKFIKAAENLTEVTKVVGKAVTKFEEHFEAATGLKSDVSLSFIVSIKFDVGGKAIWNKAGNSPLTANVKELTADLVAGIGLSGVLTVERVQGNKEQVLVKFSGSGTSEMTLSTSPRLGNTDTDRGNLWLDNTFGWKPLTVNLKVEANKSNDTKDMKPPTKPGVAPPATIPGKPIAFLPSVDSEWSGDLFKVIENVPLKSLNLTTLTWGAPHSLENPITPKPNLPPGLTPAGKPSKPAPPP